MTTKEGAEGLAANPPARDFVADAFAHQMFIDCVDGATPLLEKVCVKDAMDEGLVALEKPADCAGFIKTCGKVRFGTGLRARCRASGAAEQPNRR